MHPRVVEVTERLIERSRPTREAYLAMIRAAASAGPARNAAQCANFAHGVAGCGAKDKQRLRLPDAANVAIVTAYNDMLSAHQPYEDYPERLRQALREIGSVGQVAGGVPAMCDGVTQGEPGMELAIASREVIAMSTAVALSHNLFDAALLLGICDKIVPGLLIGALRFGHLPALFVPAGPMPSGLANKDKAAVRQRYAEGKAGRDELLAAEMQAYHSPGTCTFYGTANTNQMLMEVMGLHLPGSSFVNPGTPLRDALTIEAARQVTRLTPQGGLPHAPRRAGRRARAGQRRGCAACHRRLYQPHPAHAGHRPGGGHSADLAGHGRPLRSGADAGPRLSQRLGGHQSLPCRWRCRVAGARAARRRPAARRCAYRDGARPASLYPGALPRRWQADLA